MENFNFKEVDLNESKVATGSTSKYIKLTHNAPKVRTVKMTSATYGVTPNGEPYVRVVVEDTDGYTASKDYYVNTTVKEGRTTSSFNVSRTDFVKYLVVTGKTEDEAKNYLSEATSYEDLAVKLSVAVGKPFKMGFFGKIATSSKGEFLKTIFATGKNSIVPVSTPDENVSYNKDKDETSKYEAKRSNVKPEATKAPVDDLPF